LCSQCLSGGCRVGHREHGVFSWGASHACLGGATGPVRSRSRADAAAGRCLKVTTKSVERIAEAMGADIGQREQEEIGQACSWICPS
jgi:hypothetical protein